MLLGLFGFLASLQLAVVLIGCLALVLIWAAFYLDSRYGTKVVQFAVYGSWWFAALAWLLCANVLCAALVRLPWKRRQTGFVITHAGILVLLLGCLLTRQGGIDAQLPVFEGRAAQLAYKDTQHFRLAIYGGPQSQTPPQASTRPSRDAASQPASEVVLGEEVDIPFASGPFNWSDYAQLPWFPWRLGRRDRGVLYDRDGIKLEVLDYYADAELISPEPLQLRVNSPAKDGSGPQWQGVELTAEAVGVPGVPHRPLSLGGMQDLVCGGQVVFWVAGSQAETDAFLHSQPEGPLGRLGQVVLYGGGRRFVIPVEQFQSRPRIGLGETGLEIELIRHEPTMQAVVLWIVCGQSPPREMKLLAAFPQFNQHDAENGVFGTYWIAESAETNNGKAPTFATPRSPRIDILQGADQRLYYRVWKSPQVASIGQLPVDRTRMAVLQNTDTPITFYVERFTPHDRPGQLIRPLPFRSGKNSLAKQRQALVRLTVDGHSEAFWLEGTPMLLEDFEPLDPSQRRVVFGARRRVAVSMPWDQIDIGFQVFLHKFERRLDPGTSMPSHYSSLVDFREPGDSGRVLQEKVLITLNAPVDFSDPHTGRSYRLFQESFDGPYRPGNPRFDRYVPAESQREELFLSVLTVNYDPGRGLKYAGSLMIVAGVAAVYLTRSQLFRPRRAARQTSE